MDTVKEVDGSGRIVATPDRSRLWYAHTPQVFPAAALRRAYAGLDRGTPERAVTDDASLVEGTLTVRMVDSDGPNLKVTRPEDVAVAEALLGARPS